MFTYRIRELTPEEVKASQEASKRREAQMKEKRESSEELNCEGCGKFLCYVHEYDLNESYFWCKECKEGASTTSHA